MKRPSVDDVCARPETLPPMPTQPFAPPLYPSTVWQCESTAQAEQLLTGEATGYVYQRDAHPNADMLAEKCRMLHGAERAAVTGSGMAALTAAWLAELEPGDGVLISRHVYGKTLSLFGEAQRWGIDVQTFDPTALDDCARLISDRTRLLVVESISNPRLRVANVQRLADIAHRAGARLLVDNTFATPAVLRPLEWGADLVMESLTKLMNGHSDVVLGLLCGSGPRWDNVGRMISTWGLASSPWDCWLALRGLSSMHLRVERACATALRVAQFLVGRPEVDAVDYPGLEQHPDHGLAVRQFGDRFGSIVTFHLHGGQDAVQRFISGARRIPFCPSLGEIATTVSHPASTSHRGLSADQRDSLGVRPGTLRLSCGVESTESVLDALDAALRGGE